MLLSGSFFIYQSIPETGTKGEIATVSFMSKKSGSIGSYLQGIKLFRKNGATFTELSASNMSRLNKYGYPIYSGIEWEKKTASWKLDNNADSFKFDLQGDIYYDSSYGTSSEGSILSLLYDDFQFDHGLPNTEISNQGIFVKLSPEKYIRMDSSSMEIKLEESYINNIYSDYISANNINVVETVSASLFNGKMKDISFHAAGITDANNDCFISFVNNVVERSLNNTTTGNYMVMPYNGKLNKIKIKNGYPFGTNSKLYIVRGSSGVVPNTTIDWKTINMSSTSSIKEWVLGQGNGEFNEGDTIGIRFSGSTAPSSVGGTNNLGLTCVWEYLIND